MQVSAIGLSFYEREDYPRIRKIMVDAHNFAATYYGFMQAFERVEREYESKGLIVVRAVIKPNEFVIWCARHGLKINAEARMRFSGEIAAAEMNKRNAGG